MRVVTLKEPSELGTVPYPLPVTPAAGVLSSWQPQDKWRHSVFGWGTTMLISVHGESLGLQIQLSEYQRSIGIYLNLVSDIISDIQTSSFLPPPVDIHFGIICLTYMCSFKKKNVRSKVIVTDTFNMKTVPSFNKKGKSCSSLQFSDFSSLLIEVLC